MIKTTQAITKVIPQLITVPTPPMVIAASTRMIPSCVTTPQQTPPTIMTHTEAHGPTITTTLATQSMIRQLITVRTPPMVIAASTRMIPSCATTLQRTQPTIMTHTEALGSTITTTLATPRMTPQLITVPTLLMIIVASSSIILLSCVIIPQQTPLSIMIHTRTLGILILTIMVIHA
jgi:hypothetical protein